MVLELQAHTTNMEFNVRITHKPQKSQASRFYEVCVFIDTYDLNHFECSIS